MSSVIAIRSFQRFGQCKRSVLNRPFSSSTKFEEISFELPMGKIAGKVWGTGPQPIVAVHGWLDNCGSFDPIVPK